jgi:hypothetical protein
MCVYILMYTFFDFILKRGNANIKEMLKKTCFRIGQYGIAVYILFGSPSNKYLCWDL